MKEQEFTSDGVVALAEAGTVPTKSSTIVLPNGVKVIWQFYKPKKQEKTDSSFSGASNNDSSGSGSFSAKGSSRTSYTKSFKSISKSSSSWSASLSAPSSKTSYSRSTGSTTKSSYSKSTSAFAKRDSMPAGAYNPPAAQGVKAATPVQSTYFNANSAYNSPSYRGAPVYARAQGAPYAHKALEQVNAHSSVSKDQPSQVPAIAPYYPASGAAPALEQGSAYRAPVESLAVPSHRGGVSAQERAKSNGSSSASVGAKRAGATQSNYAPAQAGSYAAAAPVAQAEGGLGRGNASVGQSYHQDAYAPAAMHSSNGVSVGAGAFGNAAWNSAQAQLPKARGAFSHGQAPYAGALAQNASSASSMLKRAGGGPEMAPSRVPVGAGGFNGGEILEGLVERVTYHNEENGFCVLRLKVKGEYDLITMVGHASSVTAGEFVSAQGSWIFNKEFGRQFQAQVLQVYPPNTLDGIERYLGSGMVKGIGSKVAGILVKAFGEQVFDVIEQEPNKLLELQGIGKKRLALITSGWADQKVVRAIMVFLHSHGVSTSRSVRIFKVYGDKAIDIVSENPYRLAKDIRGIGFKSADTIARNIGIGEFSPLRARAGVSYALSQASSNDGHCCLPRAELIKLTNELLNIPEEIINDAIEHEIHQGDLIVSSDPAPDSIFLASLFRAEKRIAQSIKELTRERTPWPVIQEDKALEWVERKLKINLAQSQKQAVKTALNSKVMVITGGPGVGKTTIVKAILTILAAKKINIKLCAPTGRASKRLSESSGYEAMTIHRMLEVDPSTMEFKYNEDHPLECDLLVIDECSMVDIPLANNLLKAIPRHAAVIFVGDVDQLPSVGPGAFLGDLIKSQTVSVIRLTEVFRQAASSWIIRIAHQINRGQMPTFPHKEDHGDCYFVPEEDREFLAQTLVNLVQKRLPKAYGVNPIEDIQVLCPMNRGDSGARTLNLELKKALNPSNNNSITKFGTTFSVGDKVMQIENNYDREVYNGDVGFIKDIDTQEEELTVDFDGQIAVYPFSELDELVLSYACTIHKSQGSEYPIVVIPLTMQHFMMLKRNLVYTGVTRGKKLVVLVGEKKALQMAVRDWKTKVRNSGLKASLQQALSTDRWSVNNEDKAPGEQQRLI